MRTVFLAAALLFVGVPVWAQAVEKKEKVKRQTNVISFEELQSIQSEATDAYSAVERLRPQFFRIRGTNKTFGNSETLEIRVVVDNAGRGGVESLRQIPTSTVKEIRYINGTDASIQFGTNYGAGAILVQTR
jgi:hypothetical protein